MNAPVRTTDVDWRALATSPTSCLDDMRAMKLIARLAQALARPCALLESLEGRLAPLSSATLNKLAQHRFFGPPTQRAISAELRLDALSLRPDLFDRLTSSAASRLCLLVATEPFGALRALAMDMAMAIVHKRVLGLLLKKQRAFLRAAVGEEGVRLAAQEAPLLYPALGELDRGSLFDKSLDCDDEQGLRDGILDIGLAGLLRFIERTEPDLVPLFTCRRTIISDQTASMSVRHGEQAFKLLRRRQTVWSDFID